MQAETSEMHPVVRFYKDAYLELCKENTIKRIGLQVNERAVDAVRDAWDKCLAHNPCFAIVDHLYVKSAPLIPELIKLALKELGYGGFYNEIMQRVVDRIKTGRVVLSDGISKAIDIEDESNNTVTDIVYFNRIRVVRNLNEIRPRVYQLNSGNYREQLILPVDHADSEWQRIEQFKTTFLSCKILEDQFYFMIYQEVFDYFDLHKIEGIETINHGKIHDFARKFFYKRNIKDVSPRCMTPTSKKYATTVCMIASEIASLLYYLSQQDYGTNFCDDDGEYVKFDGGFFADLEKTINELVYDVHEQFNEWYLKRYSYSTLIFEEFSSQIARDHTFHHCFLLAGFIQENLKEIMFWDKEGFNKVFYYFTIKHQHDKEITSLDFKKDFFAEDFFSYKNRKANCEKDYKDFKFTSKSSQRRAFSLNPECFKELMADDRGDTYVCGYEINQSKKAKTWKYLLMWLEYTNDYLNYTGNDFIMAKAVLSQMMCHPNFSRHLIDRIPLVIDLVLRAVKQYRERGSTLNFSFIDDVADFLLARELEEEDGRLEVTDQRNINLISKRTTPNSFMRLMDKWGKDMEEYRLLHTLDDRVSEQFEDILPTEEVINGYEIRTINNPEELSDEAEEMGHCIFSFLSPIISGDYIAFTVKNKFTSERATLGVTVRDGVLWFNQCYGVGNEIVSNGLLNAVKAFIDKVNNEGGVLPI